MYKTAIITAESEVLEALTLALEYQALQQEIFET